ncbi:MAG: hypothetical protein R6X19_03390 [Kiritimatiellia bacterium]
MSLRSTARREVILRAYAMGLTQDMASALADFLAPIVPVGVATGKYKEYSDKQAFAVYNTARALGGGATRIKFEATDKSFDCTPQALEIPIDDHERDLVGVDDSAAQSDLEQAKIRTLVINAGLSREARVFELAATIANRAGFGGWTDPASDPIAELNSIIELIATRCGMMPNALAFGLGAYRALVSHPKVKADCGITGSTCDPKMVVAKLLNPAIDLRIGVLSRDTVKFGKDKSAVNVVGANVYCFIRQANPTPYDPSAMKTFVTRASGVDDVMSYRDETANSDVYKVGWSEDVKITGTACIERLEIS